MAGREVRRRGADTEIVGRVAIWAVPAGVIGARLYHVVTDWSAFSGHLERDPADPGRAASASTARCSAAPSALSSVRARDGVPLLVILDCTAPGTALAQAIGRFGNYVNQELFGGPTTCRGGSRSTRSNRPAEYLDDATFHPTFLYEALWNLIVMASCCRARAAAGGGTRRARSSRSTSALYSLGRFFVEGLRVDPAHEIGPVPAQPGRRGACLRDPRSGSSRTCARRGGRPALPSGA